MEYAQLIKNIREDIYHIDIPIEHPLKNLNIYLFKGTEPALIDAGPYHPLLVEVMEEVLRLLEVKELSRILITHSHIDHFGLADRLRRLTGVGVTSSCMNWDNRNMASLPCPAGPALAQTQASLLQDLAAVEHIVSAARRL